MLRGDFKVRQEVNDEIQTSISYIKYELQNLIENNLLEPRRTGKLFWLHGGGLKELLTMNLMGKHLKNNTTSENMTYFIDNKKICANITNFTC